MEDDTDEVCKIFRSANVQKITDYIIKKLHTRDFDVIFSYFQYLSLVAINDNQGNTQLAEKILAAMKKALYDPFIGTMTLTFGEVAESHVGMQKIGSMAERGFSYKELRRAQKYFNARGCATELIFLNNFLPAEGCDSYETEQLNIALNNDKYKAWILVARNGINCLTGDNKGENITTEMLMFKWDDKMYNERRGVVQNKLARHNLNFSDHKQTADFENGKGTTVSWAEVPILSNIKKKLIDAFGSSAADLKCEGNMYYNPGKTGIGYHGDTERRKVIGLRLGKPMTIHYMWYYNDQPRGINVSLLLNEGDIYCMSEKTVGTDWRSAPKKQYTLRHAAGSDKYTTNTGKIQIKDMHSWNENNAVNIGEIWTKPSKSLKNPTPKWSRVDDC